MVTNNSAVSVDAFTVAYGHMALMKLADSGRTRRLEGIIGS